MLRIRLVDVGLMVSVAILSISHSWAQPKPGPGQFPLAKGSYWIYAGETKWQKQGPKVFAEKVTWRMEVMNRVERNGIVAAVVRGYPHGGARELQVLIAVDGRQFYLLPAEKSVLKRLKDPRDALVDLVQEDEIEFSLPLVPGKRFCEASQITRPDGLYCWVVEEDRREKLTNVLGVAGDVEHNVYQIAFRTLPDHIVVDFAPGVGITSYEYVHHGTTDEKHLTLVEFHDGTGPPP